ncbi:MAG: hypothetical protein RIK87_08695 [Fuerstiella sp.]
MKFPWIKRPDLIAVPHDAGGWVVKDPLTLHYALLDDQEYGILNLLDGSLSFPELVRRVRETWPAAGLTAEDLSDFLHSLAGHQLIRQASTGDSDRLVHGPGRRSPLQWLLPMFQILRLQVRLLNPSRLLDAAMPVVALFGHRFVRRILVAMAVAAAALMAVNAGQLQQSLPTLQDFLGPQNMLQMLAVFVAVKILHEAGHAFTARYFGAECNECGVMLMVMTPVLYTNVSDSWLLPRRQRMLITAAGILVELVIASACALLWWAASPGLTRSVLLNTMLLCSVNTILFNGNPLLRFDGYFLLADQVGIPNLAAQASTVVKATVIQLVTGRLVHGATHPRRVFLLTYGLLAVAYRFMLTIAILKLVQSVSQQWHIEFVGAFLSAVILTGFVVMPVCSFVRDLWQAYTAEASTFRFWLRLSGAGGILVALLCVPLPRTVLAPAFVVPNAAAVYVPLSGQFLSAERYGADVHKGDLLMELSSPELQQTGIRLKGRMESIHRQLQTLLDNPATAGSELIPSLRQSLKAAQQRLEQFRAESAELTVLAPEAGTFLPPPATGPPRRDDLPELWHETPADPVNRSAWVERGTLLGYVGASEDIQILVYLQEDDVNFVRPGQTTTFFQPGIDNQRAGGVVTAVDPMETEQLPLQLAIRGLVNGQPEGDTLRPAAVTFPATVSLNNVSKATTPALYSTGYVRIRVNSMSVFRRFVRYLRQTF